MAGQARLVRARQGLVRLGRRGEAGQGRAWRVKAAHGKAGTARQVRVGCGWARLAWARYGGVRLGVARRDWQGMASQGKAWPGRNGGVRHGRAWRGRKIDRAMSPSVSSAVSARRDAAHCSENCSPASGLQVALREPGPSNRGTSCTSGSTALMFALPNS